MAWVNQGTSTAAESDTVIAVRDDNFSIVDDADTTKALRFSVGGITTATTRTLTVPDVSDTLVTLAATQTLTNKTLTAPVISTISNTGTLTLPTSTDTLVGRATTDTLTNKTLTTPTIASFANATHTHTNAAGGGQITSAALSDYVEWTTFTPDRSADSGTWTVGTTQYAKYKKVGKTLYVNMYLSGTSVSATPTELRITIPGSYTSATTMYFPLTAQDNGTGVSGSALTSSGGTTISMFKGPLGTGTWATSTTNTFVALSIAFEIQ